MTGMAIKLGTTAAMLFLSLQAGIAAWGFTTPALDRAIAGESATIVTPGKTTAAEAWQKLGAPQRLVRTGTDEFWVYRLDTEPAVQALARIQSGRPDDASGTPAALPLARIAILRFSAERVLKLAYDTQG